MVMPGATSCTGGSSHSLPRVDEPRARAWAAAGEAAAAQVEDGMEVGLGTGRAAGAGIRALARRVGGGLRCRGVPTSRASAALARELGIRVGRLRGHLDLAFDGADAVDPGGLIVKGAGGALVRERLVAQAAAVWLVLVDGPKMTGSLDSWGRLPVAAIPFGAARVAGELADLAPQRRARPQRRRARPDGPADPRRGGLDGHRRPRRRAAGGRRPRALPLAPRPRPGGAPRRVLRRRRADGPPLPSHA